jgi:hypothetical protein
MTEDLRSDHEPHREFAERQGRQRLKKRYKGRFFNSIEENNAWVEAEQQPEPDNEQ